MLHGFNQSLRCLWSLLECRRGVCAGAGLLSVWPSEVEMLPDGGGGGGVVAGMFISC